MALVWLDNNCFDLTAKLDKADTMLPISVANRAFLCEELGEDGHSYLTITSTTGTEVVRITCSEGMIVLERGISDTDPLTFAKGRCACFKVNKTIIDEYIAEAMLGGCTPSVVADPAQSDYIEVVAPAADECEWTVRLTDEFIAEYEECCGGDDCAPCVLADGVYENATITVVNGKICGTANGTNVVYTGGSCCGCSNCAEADGP